jgi:Anti-sigma-K factor rskA, C-terminal
VLHDQAAAFALDALDREEARAFERHLGLCPGCEDELEPLRLAAVALAFAGDLPPPRPELRRRVLKVEAVVIPFKRRALPLLSAAAIAACMVVALGLRARSDGGLPPLGDATAFPLHGAADGALLVTASGEAVLVVRGLPPAPAGKAYEIWVVARGRATHAGILRGSMVELSQTVPPGGRVAVTVEDAGGSETPTGLFVLRAETA